MQGYEVIQELQLYCKLFCSECTNENEKIFEKSGRFK